MRCECGRGMEQCAENPNVWLCLFCWESKTDMSKEEKSVVGDGPNLKSGVWDSVEGGVKYDTGKNRLDLVPVEAVEGIAEVLTFGARKYDDRNWEKGFPYGRIFASTLRHLFAWWKGQDLDPESGLHHLNHAGCNIFFLITFVARGVGTDDRPKTNP